MNERFLRLPEVIALTGLSRATIYRYADDGLFPRPVKLTKRAVGWKSNEVQTWLNAHGLGVSVGVSASAA